MVGKMRISSISNTYMGKTAKTVTKPIEKAIEGVATQKTAKVAVTAGLGALLAAIFIHKKPQVAVEDTTATKKTPKIYEEVIKDSDGKVVRKNYTSNSDNIADSTAFYNHNGEISQRLWYRRDGSTVQYRQDYKNGKVDTSALFDQNGSTVKMTEKYDPITQNVSFATWYAPNGTIREQVKCDERTGEVTNRFLYDNNGKLQQHKEVAVNGNTKRETNFMNSGKIVNEYNIMTGRQTAKYEYDKNGKLVDFKITPENREQETTWNRDITKEETKFLDQRKELEMAE